MKFLRSSSNINKRSQLRRGMKTPLIVLAQQRKFETIEEILLTTEPSPELLAWLDDFSDSDLRQSFWGSTILHLVLEYKPPASLVHSLIEKLRVLKPGNPQEARDNQGKTPLHRAIISGCDANVIERLMMKTKRDSQANNGGNNAVQHQKEHPCYAAKDSLGRLPLHWACANPKGAAAEVDPSIRLKCGALSKRCDNMMEITELLLKTYPEAATAKDHKGMTPLNLAIRNGAELVTIRMLDAASARQEEKARVPAARVRHLGKGQQNQQSQQQHEDFVYFSPPDAMLGSSANNRNHQILSPHVSPAVLSKSRHRRHQQKMYSYGPCCVSSPSPSHSSPTGRNSMAVTAALTETMTATSGSNRHRHDSRIPTEVSWADFSARNDCFQEQCDDDDISSVGYDGQDGYGTLPSAPVVTASKIFAAGVF